MDEWTPASLVVSSLGVIVTLLMGIIWWFLRRTITENDRAHRAMVNDITDLKTDMAVVKTDMAVVKTDMAVVKADMAVVKADITGLKADMAVVKANMAAILTLVEQRRPEATGQ